MVAAGSRLAVIGGLGRAPSTHWPARVDVRTFGSPGDQGTGELRRLECAVKQHSVDAVFVLTRWNSHVTTAQMRRVCRRHGVRLVFWRRSVDELARALATE